MNKVRLGDVAEVITKGTTPTSIGYGFQDYGINFIKIESLAENGNFLKDKFAHISSECNESLKRSQLRCNDLLFSIAGAIGRVAIVDDSILPANTNQALAIIRIPEGIINYNYLYYFLKSEAVIKQYSRKKQGVAQINLSLKDISDLIIYVPSLSQQNKIVKVLSFLDELIKKANQQNAKLDELIKSRFVEMFGEPIDNPMSWDTKRLKNISILITNGNTPKGGSENYVDDGIVFLRSQNIWRNRIDLTDVAFIDKATNQKMRKSIVKHKDILITKTGRINTENSSLGRAALYLGEDNSANINGHVYLVRLNDSVIPEYIVTILTGEAYRKYIRKVCVGGIDKRQINLDQVEEFPIIMPPKHLQQQFADFVSQVEKQKATVQQSIGKLETLNKSLMQEYFG